MNTQASSSKLILGAVVAAVVGAVVIGGAYASMKRRAGGVDDLATWRSIPVFETKGNSGRVEPLDSFARQAVDDICQIAKGPFKLALNDYAAEGEDLTKTEFKDALPLFPNGEERAYPPAELLLSWLVEPEKWENVPFIHAPHKDVRELIGAPERNDRGLHLKYISPRQIFHSEGFRTYLRDMHERERVPGYKPNGTDELVLQVRNRYQRYRAITLDPRAPLTAGLIAPPGGRHEFLGQIRGMTDVLTKDNAQGQTLLETVQKLAQLPEAEGTKEDEITLPRSAAVSLGAMRDVVILNDEIVDQWRQDVQGTTKPGEYSDEIEYKDAVAAVVTLRRAISALDDTLSRFRNELFDGKRSEEERKALGPLFREIADKVRELHVRTFEMNVALYEDGNCVRVVPAMNAGALSKKRNPNVKSQPWYSLAAVLYSDDLMADYPTSDVRRVREAWDELRDAYIDRDDAARMQKCAAAQQAFYTSLRELGEGIEVDRQELVEEKLAADERDAAIMAYTAWPNDFGLKRIDAELRYNRIDPFGGSWVISLAAIACFALSFGVLRKPMFIVAVCVLCAGILWTAYGFYLRVYVTQWAPVTNMYETVVWVAFSVSVLGAWFLLLPLVWPGIRDAWRATAFPLSFEAKSLDKWQTLKLQPGQWLALNWVSLVLRVALMVGVFYALGIDTRYSDGQRTIFALWPNLADISSHPGEMMQQLIVWAVGFVCLILSVWFVPRLLLTFVASVVFIPWDLYLRRGADLAKLASDVRARWPIGVGATVMSGFGAWIAWMAPSVLDESFSPLQPVLRSNFWLTVHVLTIVSSYAAGMLALGIGLIALTYYIFGAYRDPVALHASGGYRPAGGDDEASDRLMRRPPEAVGSLAQYAYRAIQVAVLLLATGTILGGIWADRSWGRFWGWDPKEVWALVSLLVYLAILHGRFAGWFNNFGLIFGTVIGASAILMSWYGVNFVLPKLAPDGQAGLHSYGSGSGGLPQVMSFVVALWLYQAAASISYVRNSAMKAKPIELEPELLAPGKVNLPALPAQRPWTTPAGLAVGLGTLALFAVISGIYFWSLLYSGMTWKGAFSLVLPIPATGVLLYVIVIGVLEGMGVETRSNTPRQSYEGGSPTRREAPQDAMVVD